ncbi:MAG: glutamate--tRNA ligase [Clostridia bacterium]|nr:glutamate--tRNA ligase [Clostridia bacterium]
MDNLQLANLLFPEIDKTPEYYENKYPPRSLPEGARVTRFAPSPTGFLHLGGLFAATVAAKTAHASNGIFYLRIEDTDKKREVEGGIGGIIDGLAYFGVVPDEGRISQSEDKGDYGPYRQSERREIYQTFAKALVENGLAYPCFCSEEDLAELRAAQENEPVKGYHGKWAKCRTLGLEQIQENLAAGKPWTLRLRSQGDPEKKIIIDDFIRGKIEMPANVADIVLLKQDGIPTYHFAHCVDDHLMRSTHIVRGDEWIASVPVHIELFKACGFKVPKYAHIAPIMKEECDESGNVIGKRKLSKRKDPEASVSFYAQAGYPAESVNEYLLTLANSNFEDWRRANPDAPQEAFPFNLKKMSASGALFDLAKLNDVSKNVICRFSAQKVYENVLAWAKEQDSAFYELLAADADFAVQMFAIDRGGKKPRKDIAKWSEVKDYYAYFFRDLYENDFALPENVSREDAAAIVRAYKEVYSAADDKDAWFARIKELCAPLGFTPNVKEYKKAPDAFKGHVGDVSGIIRIAVTGRRNTPDLCAILALLGEEEVNRRLEAFLEKMN